MIDYFIQSPYHNYFTIYCNKKNRINDNEIIKTVGVSKEKNNLFPPKANQAPPHH